RHPLIRQAFYESVPAGLRAALHHRIARSQAQAAAPAEHVAEQLLAAPEAIYGWALEWIADHAATLTHQGPARRRPAPGTGRPAVLHRRSPAGPARGRPGHRVLPAVR